MRASDRPSRTARITRSTPSATESSTRSDRWRPTRSVAVRPSSALAPWLIPWTTSLAGSRTKIASATASRICRKRSAAWNARAFSTAAPARAARSTANCRWRGPNTRPVSAPANAMVPRTRPAAVIGAHIHDRNSSVWIRARCSSSRADARIMASSISGMIIAWPVRATACAPTGASGSAGYRRRSSSTSATRSGSRWATATGASVPSASNRSTAHQSATPGTIRSAIWRSVAALSRDAPRMRPASAMNAASVTSSGSRMGASGGVSVVHRRPASCSDPVIGGRAVNGASSIDAGAGAKRAGRRRAAGHARSARGVHYGAACAAVAHLRTRIATT